MLHNPEIEFVKLKKEDGTVWGPAELSAATKDPLLMSENSKKTAVMLNKGFDKIVSLTDKAAVETLAKLSVGGYREDELKDVFDALQHMGGGVKRFALFAYDVDLQCFRAFDTIDMDRNERTFFSMMEVFTVEEIKKGSRIPFQQVQGEEIKVTTANYGTAAAFDKFFKRDNPWANIPKTLALVPQFRVEKLCEHMWDQIFDVNNYGISSSTSPGQALDAGVVGGDTAAEARDKRMIKLNAAYMEMLRTKPNLIDGDGNTVKRKGKAMKFKPFWQPQGSVLIYSTPEVKQAIDTDLKFYANPDNAGTPNAPIARYNTIGTQEKEATYEDAIMLPLKAHKYLPYTNIQRDKDHSAATFSDEYYFDWSYGLAHFGNIPSQKVWAGRRITNMIVAS